MTYRLTVGFVPLLDCAPLVVAAANGFAAAQGLEIDLVRESSWANIRDRVIVGHLNAAHMLGPMPVASTLGIGHLKVPMVAPMALGLGGNAITVSRALWDHMQVCGAHIGADPAAQGTALKAVVQQRARAGDAPLTIAMVYPFSCHNYELRYWLAACGIDPDEDVALVVIPPPYMMDALRTGQVDGFCAGEPWNSLAVANGAGCIVAATSAVWHRSPEKVLGMRSDWASEHPVETAALVRAVYDAAEWCDRPGSRSELAALLARPEFIGQPPDILEPALSGRLLLAADAPPLDMVDFLVYSRHAATFPWTSHALWFYSQMVRWKQLAGSDAAAAAARACYRPDIYRDALRARTLELPSLDTKMEQSGAPGAPLSGFFDGRRFDPDDLNGYVAWYART